jgi:hypothetical protein
LPVHGLVDDLTPRTIRLAARVDEAVRAAIADSGVERPFVAWVGFRMAGPFGWTASAVLRDRVQATGESVGRALEIAPTAGPPEVAQLDVVEYLDEDALGVCAELGAAIAKARTGDATAYAIANSALGSLREALTRSLNAAPPPGADPAFLALVPISSIDGFVDPLEDAREVVGSSAVERFLQGAHAGGGGAVVAPRRTAPHGLPTGVDEFKELLRLRGLDTRQIAVALRHARPAIQLVPDARSRSASVLGGASDGPEAAAQLCPHEPGLVLLAAISLAEVQPNPYLPPIGGLAFLADPDREAELYDGCENAVGSPARLVFAEQPIVVAGTPVAIEPILGVPAYPGAGSALLGDAVAAAAYDATVASVDAGALTSASMFTPSLITPAGDDADEPVVLLRIGSGVAAGIDLLGGGFLEYQIDAAALRDGDWSQVVAYGESP